MDTVTSNSVTYKIVNRTESEDARKIDATCKNKWKWSRLEEKDVNGGYLSAYVRKLMLVVQRFVFIVIKL